MAGLLAECSFVPTGMGLAAILLVFPTGALPSRRWRPAAAAMAAATALMLAAFVVRPRQLQLPAPGGVSAAGAEPGGPGGRSGTALSRRPAR